MKFKKILLVNIDKSKLDKPYWNKIYSLSEKVVSLENESPEFKKELANTDCLLLGFGVSVTKGDLKTTPNLRYIGVLATAYAKVDVAAAKEKGIIVCNLPGYSSESVAEFVIATLLETLRDLESAKEKARESDYSGDGFSAKEIRGKVIGIFGLGHIGSRVAELAKGFDADVRYWSRNRKEEYEKKGIKFQDADSLLKEADFISLHFALVPKTEKFLNEKRFELIKPGAVIVNTAPMELVDINALEKRLGKGDITFILDHSDEMSEEDLARLKKFENCIIYPPIAYVSQEARIAKQEMFVGSIENFLKGSPVNTAT